LRNNRAVIPSRADGEGPHNRSLEHANQPARSINWCVILRFAQDDNPVTCNTVATTAAAFLLLAPFRFPSQEWLHQRVCEPRLPQVPRLAIHRETKCGLR